MGSRLSSETIERYRLQRRRPLSEQVAHDIRRRIECEEWKDSDVIPSETALAAAYGVSRNTVREAIGRLASEGRLTARQGVGTMVATPPPNARYDLRRLHSIIDVLGEQGKNARMALHRKLERPATQLEAEKLELAAGTPLLHIERALLVDERVISFCYDRYPRAIFSHLPEDDQWRLSFLDILEGQGIVVDQAHVEIHAVSSKDIGWGPDKADEPQLYVMLEQYHRANGHPMIYSETYYIEGRHQIFIESSRDTARLSDRARRS